MQKNITYLLTIFIFTLSCKQTKTESSTNMDTTEKSNYQYKKILFQYDLENQNREDVELYIGKNNDTTASQIKYYQNGILNPYKSCYYQLNYDWKKDEKKINGQIKYFNDTIQDGKLTHILFKVESNHNGIKKTKDFWLDNPTDNAITFDFSHDSDTITGVIFVQHLKVTDTISEKGNKAYQMREKLLFVDNYIFNNNPYLGKIELEEYNLEKYGLN